MSETRKADACGEGKADLEEAADLAPAPPREFVVALCVRDPSDAGTQPRGKQRLKSGGIWYTAQSGIWQPVWMEVVPARRVLALALHPDADAGTLTADVDVSGDAGLVRIYVCDPTGRQVGAGAAFAEEGSVPVGELRLLGRRGRPAACACGSISARCAAGAPTTRVSTTSPCASAPMSVRSYTAFRTVKVAPDGAGRFRFFLNGEPLLLRGVLDQGYWSDGLMTAPSDAALAFDIQAMRDAGFNMVRKHLKVEADRWYYHCDRRGMLVWQDMVSGGGAYDGWETSYKPTLWRGSWGDYERHLGVPSAAARRR